MVASRQRYDATTGTTWRSFWASRGDQNEWRLTIGIRAPPWIFGGFCHAGLGTVNDLLDLLVSHAQLLP